jgi:solute carrier family 35 protein E1
MTLLNKINPVSHSIINTLKRVIILITCCIFFNTDISINGIIGSTIAIIGSFIYSKIKINKNK